MRTSFIYTITNTDLRILAGDKGEPAYVGQLPTGVKGKEMNKILIILNILTSFTLKVNLVSMVLLDHLDRKDRPVGMDRWDPKVILVLRYVQS